MGKVAHLAGLAALSARRSASTRALARRKGSPESDPPVGIGRSTRHALRMQPDTGGRFSLRLCDHDASHARYELQLVTRDGEWSTGVQVLGADGQIECGPWHGEGEPPPWLLHYSRAALRSAWHSHREQGWPRRLTRWRDAPARGESGASRRD